MKKTTLLIPLLFLALTLNVQAGEPKVVTLKDGSRIQGRIVGIDNGHYVIDSSTLGEVKVPEDSVVSIVLPGPAAAAVQTAPGNTTAAAPSTNAGNSAERIKAVQNQIVSNPAIMADIQTLMQDPDVMAAISDPAFLQAAQSGNTQAVESSPQLQKLMNNPKIQDIVQKLQASQPAH